MGHLLLARHASTHASKNHRNLGQKDDPPLASYGRKLADRLGVAVEAELDELAVSDLRLMSSPATRARQTTDAIASHLHHPAEVEVEARLIEIDYGAWEGLKPEECARRDPELRAAWEADPFTTQCRAASQALMSPSERSRSSSRWRDGSRPIHRELRSWSPTTTSIGSG
jgi:broad specificity phosphatase PhoE